MFFLEQNSLSEFCFGWLTGCSVSGRDMATTTTTTKERPSSDHSSLRPDVCNQITSSSLPIMNCSVKFK